MPFIGKDWRSPGEAWVKTETFGWQRMKIIESQLYSSCHNNHVACSWPPRTHFGQHMAENCGSQCSSPGQSVDRVGSRSSNISTYSSSLNSESSRAGSISPSFTDSPNKTGTCHLHPITICSPYGRYSCCMSYGQGDLTASNTDEEVQESVCLSPESDKSLVVRRIVKKTAPTNNVTSPEAGKEFLHDTKSSQDNPTSTTPSKLISNIRLRERCRSSSPNLLRNSCNDYSRDPDQRKHDAMNISDDGIDQNKDSRCRCCCTSQQFSNQGSPHIKDSSPKTAPHCRISVRTREVAIYNTISEAFYRLDFCNAIHDIRRFNYICKLLHLLITQNLTSLGGCATKVLFSLLEQVAWEVSSNKRNIHVLKELLEELRQTIKKYYCWGRPIGSSALWQQHFDTIERISRIVDGIELSSPKHENNRVTFNELPIEMIREILLRLNDYRDLVNSAKASPVMQTMIDSQYIWQQLCRYHFTDHQLKLALKSRDLNSTSRNALRGIKYARTVSADGRVSYRNPVEHTQLQNHSSLARNDSFRPPISSERVSSQTAAINSISRQQPTNLISDNSTTQTGSTESANLHANSDDNIRLNQTNQQNANLSSHDNCQNDDINWKRMFHQLRKKYDLKEEYADCLLLCRHCRCLFWKSIGHPCILDENLSGVESEQSNRQLQCDAPLPAQNRLNCNRSDNLGYENIAGSQNLNGVPMMQNRPSVASLSRNFNGGSSRAENIENIPLQNERISVINQAVHARRIIQGANQRLLRQEAPEQRAQRNHNGGIELVPEHVTISPQAFLKFFSL